MGSKSKTLEKFESQADSSSEDKYENRPKPNDFIAFLPWACNQYQLDSEVVVTKLNLSKRKSTLPMCYIDKSGNFISSY